MLLIIAAVGSAISFSSVWFGGLRLAIWPKFLLIAFALVWCGSALVESRSFPGVYSSTPEGGFAGIEFVFVILPTWTCFYAMAPGVLLALIVCGSPDGTKSHWAAERFILVVPFVLLGVFGIVGQVRKQVHKIDKQAESDRFHAPWREVGAYASRARGYDGPVDYVRYDFVSGDRLQPLRELTHLKTLHLQDTAVTDDDLVNIAHLATLEELTLAGTEITDQGLASLAKLTSLRELDCTGAPIIGTGLVHLKDLSNLTKLNLSKTKLTDDEIVDVSRLTSVEEVDLSYTRLSDLGLVHLLGMTELQALDLRGTRITNEGLKVLLDLPALQSVNLSQTYTTQGGVTELRLDFAQRSRKVRIRWERTRYVPSPSYR